MKKFDLSPPSGTRDLLPQDVKCREWALGEIRQIFERSGFLPIDTPALERVETITGKYGDEGEKLIFKILKRGKETENDNVDLALRYDLTVPFARFFSKHRNQLPLPFRRYQIGPVWRADRPGKGRLREFYQCDIDIIGTSSLMAEAEAILTIANVLSRLGLSDYTIRLNSRKALDGLLETCGVPNSFRKKTLIILDKIDKVGVNDAIQELKNSGLSKLAVSKIASSLSKKSNDLKNQINASVPGKVGIKEIEEIMSLVTPVLGQDRINFSPFLARGLDYYTGSIFEIYFRGVDGAVASGGHYDNLIGLFAGKPVPACGISLGIDRLLLTNKRICDQYRKEKPATSLVFLTLWDQLFRTDILQMANELRDVGIATEVSLNDGKIRNQIRYASKRGAQYCIFYGPAEKSRGVATIKDLSSGEQTIVKRKQISQTLKNLL